MTDHNNNCNFTSLPFNIQNIKKIINNYDDYRLIKSNATKEREKYHINNWYNLLINFVRSP